MNSKLAAHINSHDNMSSILFRYPAHKSENFPLFMHAHKFMLMIFNSISLQLVEDVARKKAEYQKHLEYYKQLRMRFEEHYIKCEFRWKCPKFLEIIFNIFYSRQSRSKVGRCPRKISKSLPQIAFSSQWVCATHSRGYRSRKGLSNNFTSKLIGTPPNTTRTFHIDMVIIF
jgi:hypothetical protein